MKTMLVAVLIFIGNYAGACQVSCGGSAHVKVDVASRCMCIGRSCFSINTGKSPLLTSNGTGTIRGGVEGGKYQTKSRTSNAFDNDALSTGISMNNARGKWIHKAHKGNKCIGTGVVSTDGCIGVPCDKWDEVKAQTGSKITVCGGAPEGSGFTKDKRGNVIKIGAKQRRTAVRRKNYR